jgi:hypothetical protein
MERIDPDSTSGSLRGLQEGFDWRGLTPDAVMPAPAEIPEVTRPLIYWLKYV